MIIGAEKSGTSSLHYYLDQHPLLDGSNPKELHYFDREKYYNKNIIWYENHFCSLRKKIKHFESTPNYIYYESIARNIKDLYPEIKLILLLREPIKRAYSAWNMHKKFFESKKSPVSKFLPDGSSNPLYNYFYKNRSTFPSFEECIQLELDEKVKNTKEPAIVRRGLYFDQIQNYLKYFSRDQLMILGIKDLKERKIETLNNLMKFLELPQFNWKRIDLTEINKRTYTQAMKSDTRKRLQDFYSEPNKKLFENFGEINW
ncbi:MAG: sulfotransferase domain-containing protein [Candidatus Rifleibacteriota bacterium]